MGRSRKRPGHHHARPRPLLCDRRPRRAGRLNKGSEHKLGDWGFVVDASTQATPAAKAAAKAAAKNKTATP